MRLNSGRLAWTFAVVTFSVGASATFLAPNSVQSAQEAKAESKVDAKVEEKSEPKPEAKPEAKPEMKEAVIPSYPNRCLSDPVVLDELKKKREEMDSKQRDLQTREAELKARETALNDEMKKLQEIRDEISKIETTQKQGNQDRIAKVIETLQAMGPKNSAQFLTTLDDGLAIAAISQMDTVKLAKIMNVIEPKRGARLTELLAGVVRANHSLETGKEGASNDATATTGSKAAGVSPRSGSLKKGEEKNDTTNNSNKPESIISSGGPEVGSQSK